MNIYIFFLIFMASFTRMIAQQPPSQEQMIQETQAELALLRNELARPIAQGNQPAPEASATRPNLAQIEAKKRQLRCPQLDHLSNTIFDARGDGVYMMHLTQEVIGHVVSATIVAHESALQEHLINKGAMFDRAHLQREKAEEHLGTLQEIKQHKEEQEKKAAEFQKACTNFTFLKEEVLPLTQKIDLAMNHLSAKDQELTAQIATIEDTLRRLKQPPH